MIALAVILAGTLAALVGTVIYLAHGAIVGSDHAADARVAQADTEAYLERAQYELEICKQALAAEAARANALEEAFAHDAPTNADLDSADVDGRMRRLAQAWGAANRDPIPADPGGEVRPAAPASSPATAPLPAGSATVR